MELFTPSESGGNASATEAEPEPFKNPEERKDFAA
jgi:hypothetical protein